MHMFGTENKYVEVFLQPFLKLALTLMNNLIFTETSSVVTSIKIAILVKIRFDQC